MVTIIARQLNVSTGCDSKAPSVVAASYNDAVLTKLTLKQLDSVAPVGADGVIDVDTVRLAGILAGYVGSPNVALAISSTDYDQHADGSPEPATRAIKGVWWVSTGVDRARVGSFRSDGMALSITDEGEKLSPIAEDVELVAKAILVIAGQYEDSEVRESARIGVIMPDGTSKQIRVVVIRDPRIVRPKDVLTAAEFIAYQANRLGIVLVQPVANGHALVRKMGC